MIQPTMTERAFTVLAGLDQVPPDLKGGVVAIGNFDGFHRGHQQVFTLARTMAAARSAKAIIVTFEPHPRDVFADKPFLFRLTDAERKAQLAETLGFDAIVVMPFSRDLAGLEAQAFVDRYLRDALGVSGVAVGGDFHFGKGRAGTPDFLKAAGAAGCFAVEIVPMLADAAEAISSSRVRTALASTRVAEANSLLGYHFLVSGTVVTGDRRGRALGYPTANFDLPETSQIAQGVYAIRCKIGTDVFDGVASYGKPMFDNARPPFEAHLFDFDRDIYGQTITVALVGYIRGGERFAGLDELIAAMDRDSHTARIMIASARPLSELDAALGFVTG